MDAAGRSNATRIRISPATAKRMPSPGLRVVPGRAGGVSTPKSLRFGKITVSPRSSGGLPCLAMRTNGDRTTATRPDQTPTRRRLTAKAAAEDLGITVEAVRGRIKRGTLPYEKAPDGTVYVFLDADWTIDQTTAGRDRTTDQSQPDGRPDELVEELRSRIAYLERQVEEEREARRRADTLMARLMDRVPELQAPHHEAHQDVQEDAQEPRHGTGGVKDGEEPERRSWWRRVFG